MKNLVFIGISILFLVSCSIFRPDKEYIEPEIQAFGDEIIDHPEKLRDIKNNFPDLYCEKYLSSNMIPSQNINGIIQDIERTFEKKTYGEFSKEKYYEWEIPRIYSDMNLSGHNFHSYLILNSPEGIQVVFIRKDELFYLHNIGFVE